MIQSGLTPFTLGAALAVAACGGETDSFSRIRPEHLDSGTPSFEDDSGIGGGGLGDAVKRLLGFF